jgi:hypothetical protein
VLLGIERILDQVPFPPDAVDQGRDALDPAKVLEAFLAALAEAVAEVVGAVERKQAECLLPRRGLASFLEGQHGRHIPPFLFSDRF